MIAFKKSERTFEGLSNMKEAICILCAPLFYAPWHRKWV